MQQTEDSAVRVLAVTGNRDSAQRLRDLFNRTRWRLLLAGSRDEAKKQIRDEHPSVVLCEARLSDGCWREILEDIRGLEHPPQVIVTSNQADEQLWTEVLTEGGYDVLPRPFERGELFRIISLAWRDWWHRRESPPHVHAATA